MSVWTWIAVAALGGAGAVARFLLDTTIARWLGRAFPYGTLAINLSGAFALGLLTGLALTGTALTLAGTAALGAYTTFSTWMFETQRLAEDGSSAAAVANVIVSLAAGFGVALLGRSLGVALR